MIQALRGLVATLFKSQLTVEQIGADDFTPEKVDFSDGLPGFFLLFALSSC